MEANARGQSIDPEGRPSYSRATAPPNPPATWNEGMAAADRHVAQLRDWGFDGLAGWHSLRLDVLCSRELKKQGRPRIPQLAVLNYHDCFKHGQYDVLTDRRGRQKSGEHGFPDPFDIHLATGSADTTMWIWGLASIVGSPKPSSGRWR